MEIEIPEHKDGTMMYDYVANQYVPFQFPNSDEMALRFLPQVEPARNLYFNRRKSGESIIASMMAVLQAYLFTKIA